MITHIHPKTTTGAVALTVADLSRSVEFYRSGLGMQVHLEMEGTAYLGAGGQDLLVLSVQPGAQPVQGVTGLYHFALLLPSRQELARMVRHLQAAQIQLTGTVDHAVSEAVYLADPDGHGIEISWDRPRDVWQVRNGVVKIASDELDMKSLLAEGEEGWLEWEGLHPETVIGHVHLHVADLAAAERFYTEALGMQVTARYGKAALFVSAGGYHHHIGLNTWAGEGAPAPPPDAARLLWAEIRFPDEAALAEAVERVAAAGVALESRDGGWLAHDPSGNALLLVC